jgi:hypothetical protein
MSVSDFDTWPAGILLLEALEDDRSIEELVKDGSSNVNGVVYKGGRRPPAMTASCEAYQGIRDVDYKESDALLVTSLALGKFVANDRVTQPLTEAERLESKQRLWTLMHSAAAVGRTAKSATIKGAYTKLLEKHPEKPLSSAVVPSRGIKQRFAEKQQELSDASSSPSSDDWKQQATAALLTSKAGLRVC